MDHSALSRPPSELRECKGKFLYSAVSSPQDRQSTLHFTSLTDLFTQTPSRLLWEASSHMLQLMCEGCSYTYPPLSIARYSFIQLNWSNVEWKKLAQGFNTAAQDSNPGSFSQESGALPLSHCTLPLSHCTLPLGHCTLPLGHCTLPLGHCTLLSGL